MKRIEVTTAKDFNWYKVGDIFDVLDEEKYAFLGIQVVRPNNGREPDVVQHGHYRFIEE